MASSKKKKHEHNTGLPETSSKLVHPWNPHDTKDTTDESLNVLLLKPSKRKQSSHQILSSLVLSNERVSHTAHRKHWQLAPSSESRLYFLEIPRNAVENDKSNYAESAHEHVWCWVEQSTHKRRVLLLFFSHGVLSCTSWYIWNFAWSQDCSARKTFQPPEPGYVSPQEYPSHTACSSWDQGFVFSCTPSLEEHDTQKNLWVPAAGVSLIDESTPRRVVWRSFPWSFIERWRQMTLNKGK